MEFKGKINKVISRALNIQKGSVDDLVKVLKTAASAGIKLRDEFIQLAADNAMVVEACTGCKKILDGISCSVYANPFVVMRWVDGKSLAGCGFNYRNIVKPAVSKARTRVGQQKQKRKNRR